MFFLEIRLFVKIQIAEHAAIAHIMVIDNRIVIRKVRLVFSFQKDASGDVLFFVNIAAEIFLIVPRVQHRIADVKILRIGVLDVSFGSTCFHAGYTVGLDKFI